MCRENSLEADRLKLGQRICRKDSFFHKCRLKKIHGNMNVPGERIEEETKDSWMYYLQIID